MPGLKSLPLQVVDWTTWTQSGSDFADRESDLVGSGTLSSRFGCSPTDCRSDKVQLLKRLRDLSQMRPGPCGAGRAHGKTRLVGRSVLSAPDKIIWYSCSCSCNVGVAASGTAAGAGADGAGVAPLLRPARARQKRSNGANARYFLVKANFLNSFRCFKFEVKNSFIAGDFIGICGAALALLPAVVHHFDCFLATTGYRLDISTLTEDTKLGMKRSFNVTKHEKGTSAFSNDVDCSTESTESLKRSRLTYDDPLNIDSKIQHTSSQINAKEAKYDSTIPQSKFAGVHWNRKLKKWRVRIKVHGQDKDVGYFDDEDTAAWALDRAIGQYDSTRPKSSQQDSMLSGVELHTSKSHGGSSGINMILAAVHSETIESALNLRPITSPINDDAGLSAHSLRTQSPHDFHPTR
jgi:hypothetical protein